MRAYWKSWEGVHHARAAFECSESPALACTPLASANIELELQLGHQAVCEYKTCEGVNTGVPLDPAQCSGLVVIPVQVSLRVNDTELHVFAPDERLLLFADGHVELRTYARNPATVRAWLNPPHEMGILVHVTLQQVDGVVHADASIETEQVDTMVGVTGLMHAAWNVR